MKLKFSKLEVNSDSITINFGNETKTYDNVKNWSKDYEINIQDNWLVKNDKGEFDFSKIVIYTDVSTFKQDSVKFMITDGLTGGDLKKVYIVKVYQDSGYYKYAFIDEDLNYSVMDYGGSWDYINNKYKIYRAGELTDINKNDIDNFENEVIYINMDVNGSNDDDLYAPAVLATYIDNVDSTFKLKVRYTAEEITETDDAGDEYTYTNYSIRTLNINSIFDKRSSYDETFIQVDSNELSNEKTIEVNGSLYYKIEEYDDFDEYKVRDFFSEEKPIYLITLDPETGRYIEEVKETKFIFPSYEDWVENI